MSRASRGFTLLEMSLVILIISLISGVGMSTVQPTLEMTRRSATEEKLNTIEKALSSYREVHGRLPCPSNNSLAESSASFGVEGTTPGTCTGANFSDSTKNVAEGGVPFKTLNLPKEFAYDGWGRRIAYSVWLQATGQEGVSSTWFGDILCGNITIRDSSGGSRDTRAIYLLISYGANGHGAFKSDGTRYYTGSTNADEWQNCNCNATAATTYDTIYVQRDANYTSATDQFDDIVRYKMRRQLQRDPSEAGDACINGVRFEGATAGDGLNSATSGDINGDGLKDLIIGGGSSGKVYVVFGKRGGWRSPINLGLLNGTDGFAITGLGFGGGGGLGSADINGDGYQEIFAGRSGGGGMAYVIFGHAAPFSASYDASPSSFWNGAQGFKITQGISGSPKKLLIRTTADFNSDGRLDLVLSDQDANSNGLSASGAVYVLYGRAIWTDITITSTYMDGTSATGFELDGENDGDALGANNVIVTDMDNDGRLDFVIGNEGYPKSSGGTQRGAIYILYGQPGGWAAKTTVTSASGGIVDGTKGVRLQGWGYPNETYYGTSVTVADVNGDGLKDIIDTNGWNSIAAQVVFGQTPPWTPNSVVAPTDPQVTYCASCVAGAAAANTITIDPTYYRGADNNAATTADNRGIRFVRSTSAEMYNYVAVADMNGDNTADILIRGQYSDTQGRTDNGTLYVIYGQASGNPLGLTSWGNSAQTLNSSFFTNAVNGYRIDGEATNDLFLAGTPADINGDGKLDIIGGASGYDPTGRTDAGAAYLIFNRRNFGVTTDLYTYMNP